MKQLVSAALVTFVVALAATAGLAVGFTALACFI